MNAPGPGAAVAPDDDLVAMLRDSARRFASAELAPSRLRALRGEPVPHSAATWRAMAGLGWTGLLVPQELGGSGLGLAAMAAVLEELGASLLPEPLVPCAVLAATALVHADDRPARSALLRRLADGSLLPALAWQEGAGALTDPARIRTRASVRGGRLVLDGEKRFVRPGAGADGLVVAAARDDGLGLYWVPAGAEGVHAAVETTTDGGASGRVTLAGVAVPDEHVLASPATGRDALERAIDAATVATGAELVGLMRGAMDRSLEHLRTRRQFGRPIGSFQALRHRAVDLYLQQQLSAALVDEASRAFDAAPAGAQRAMLASRVKARTADAALLIAREAVHFHGAMGYTDECDIGLYLKRALSLAGWLGTAAEHRRRYGALRYAPAAAGATP